MKATHLFRISCPHQKGGMILREVVASHLGTKLSSFLLQCFINIKKQEANI